MTDARSLRRRVVACGIALVLALGAAAFLVLSVRQRNEARTDLAHAQVALRRARATSSRDGRDLTRARHAVGAVRDQLATITTGASAIGKLDDQDRDAVRSAVQAGLAGNLDAFNTAVDELASLDPEHDTALEQLREQVNAAITALDQVTGRTAG
jgi:hypothetical protein